MQRLSQIALVFCSIAAVISLLLYFKNSDTLYIKHIEVSGDLKHITKENVARLSGIKPKDKLFSVSLAAIARGVSHFPWIKSVQARREFPDTIQIHVNEREASAILKLRDFYYVDGQGRAFKKLGRGDSLDLPVISGFDDDFVKLYPQLSGVYLKQTAAFLAFVQDREFYRDNTISEISFDPVAGFTVYTLRDGLEIHYGRADFEKKHDKLEKFYKSPHFNITRYVRMDLDAKNKVITRALQ